MEIRVKLSGNLIKYFEGERRLCLQTSATIGDLIDHLAIDPREVGVIALNGRLADGSVELGEGDRVDLFPLIGGG